MKKCCGDARHQRRRDAAGIASDDVFMTTDDTRQRAAIHATTRGVANSLKFVVRRSAKAMSASI